MEWLCSLTSNKNKAIPPQFHKTLTELIEALIKPETLKRDLFFALLLIVIKENDFVQKGNTEIDVVDYILTKSKEERLVYDIHIVLYPFVDTPANIIVCTLNDTMLINGIVDATKETHSLCLPINEHLTISGLGIPSTFAQIDDLVTSLKEKIVTPVKNSILSYHSQPCSNLYGLPNDALFQVLLSLSLTDILNVAKSSKKLNQVLKEENLWSRLCKRDYSQMNKKDGTNWYSVYKKEYLKRAKEKAKKKTKIVRETVFDEADEWPVRDSRWEVIL